MWNGRPRPFDNSGGRDEGWHKLQREDKIQQLFPEILNIEVLALELSDAQLAGRIYADLERTGQPIGLADVTIACDRYTKEFNLT